MAFAEALKLLDQSRQGVPKAGSEGPAATPPTSSGRKTVSAFRVAPPGISVSGIIQGPEGPVAMINNRIVVVGDTVNKHKVVRIGKTSVELERDGKRFLVGISTPGARSSPVQDVPEDDEEPPAEGK
jgi:hypothetical protein